jgi:hypothetical protein
VSISSGIVSRQITGTRNDADFPPHLPAVQKREVMGKVTKMLKLSQFKTPIDESTAENFINTHLRNVEQLKSSEVFLNELKEIVERWLSETAGLKMAAGDGGIGSEGSAWMTLALEVKHIGVKALLPKEQQMIDYAARKILSEVEKRQPAPLTPESVRAAIQSFVESSKEKLIGQADPEEEFKKMIRARFKEDPDAICTLAEAARYAGKKEKTIRNKTKPPSPGNVRIADLLDYLQNPPQKRRKSN